MTEPRVLNLSAVEATELVQREVTRAAEALQARDLETALDACVRTLGLVLQLGPAATEQGLVAILQVARTLALRQDTDGLSALGPALVGLVTQVRDAALLNNTPVMEAWAIFAVDLGALIGQVGLVLTIPVNHRRAMIDNARSRAALLDDATGGRFALSVWVDNLFPPAI